MRFGTTKAAATFELEGGWAPIHRQLQLSWLVQYLAMTWSVNGIDFELGALSIDDESLGQQDWARGFYSAATCAVFLSQQVFVASALPCCYLHQQQATSMFYLQF